MNDDPKMLELSSRMVLPFCSVAFMVPSTSVLLKCVSAVCVLPLCPLLGDESHPFRHHSDVLEQHAAGSLGRQHASTQSLDLDQQRVPAGKLIAAFYSEGSIMTEVVDISFTSE